MCRGQANYVADTPAFRRTVAWSYAVTYGTTLSGFILIRLCLGGAMEGPAVHGVYRYLPMLFHVLPLKT